MVINKYGIAGMAYDTDVSEVIKQGVDIWARAVSADLDRNPTFNISNMYRWVLTWII